MQWFGMELAQCTFIEFHAAMGCAGEVSNDSEWVETRDVGVGQVYNSTTCT